MAKEQRQPRNKAGRADELETRNLAKTKFHVRPQQILPDPTATAIPFGKVGMPIPDIQQRHASYREVIHMEDPYSEFNPLPFQFWTGTQTRQINQGAPTFRLPVNENRINR